MPRGSALPCVLLLATAAVAGSCASHPTAAGPARTTVARSSMSTPAAPSAPSATSEPPIAAPDVQLPAVNHTTLPNGFAIWHVPSRSLPTVHLRLVLRAGWNLDRDRPGLSHLTALALAGVETHAAGALLPRADVRVTECVTSFAFDLPRNELDEAVDAFGTMARQPHLDNPPLALLRDTLLRRNEALKSDPVLLAHAIASHELFGWSPLPTSAELTKITAADCKALHKTAFAPSNAGLVAVGDVTFDDVVQAARRAFGEWNAPALAAQPATPASAVPYTRVVVAARPGLDRTAILVAAAGPPAVAPTWPPLWLAHALLTSSLPPGSQCRPIGPAPMLGLDAGTSSVAFSTCQLSAGRPCSDAVGASLDALKRWSSAPPDAGELESARSWFHHSLANQLPSTASLADLLAGSLGAGADHDGTARMLAQARAADASAIRDAVRGLVRQGVLVVAVGPEGSMAEDLARLGDVTVVDADAGLARQRQVPAAPAPQAPQR